MLAMTIFSRNALFCPQARQGSNIFEHLLSPTKPEVLLKVSMMSSYGNRLLAAGHDETIIHVFTLIVP